MTAWGTDERPHSAVLRWRERVVHANSSHSIGISGASLLSQQDGKTTGTPGTGETIDGCNLGSARALRVRLGTHRLPVGERLAHAERRPGGDGVVRQEEEQSPPLFSDHSLFGFAGEAELLSRASTDPSAYMLGSQVSFRDSSSTTVIPNPTNMGEPSTSTRMSSMPSGSGSPRQLPTPTSLSTSKKRSQQFRPVWPPAPEHPQTSSASASDEDPAITPAILRVPPLTPRYSPAFYPDFAPTQVPPTVPSQSQIDPRGFQSAPTYHIAQFEDPLAPDTPSRTRHPATSPILHHLSGSGAMRSRSAHQPFTMPYTPTTSRRVQLKGVPRRHIVSALNARAGDFWDRPETADCRICERDPSMCKHKTLMRRRPDSSSPCESGNAPDCHLHPLESAAAVVLATHASSWRPRRRVA